MSNYTLKPGHSLIPVQIWNASVIKKLNKTDLLNQLAAGVQRQEKLRGKLHQVFRLSFDARKCFSEKMVEQKLNYIHHNPVRGKWQLVDDFTRYVHSSAGFYELGEVGKFAVTHL